LEKTKTRPDFFYDVSVLPHPKQTIVAAIERQIVVAPIDIYANWLRSGTAFLRNFLEGVGSTPVPLIGGLDVKLPRNAAPEVLQQIAKQMCADDERPAQFRTIAEREAQQIEERMTAAMRVRSQRLARMQATGKSPAGTTANDYRPSGMAMGRRRIIDSSAFILAVVVAAYAKYGFGTNWYLAVGLAALVFILTPFVVSRVWAIYHIRRMERAAERIADRNYR
jgi:hypothetical protein